MISTFFGEEELNDDILMVSIKIYISLEQKETVEVILSELEYGNEELLEMLSFYKCYKKPTRENLRRIILELAQQEIVQKPRYIANWFKEILLSSRCDQMLKSVEGVLEFYKTRSPTARKLINALICDPKSDSETSITVEFGEVVSSICSKSMFKHNNSVSGICLL